MDVHKFRVAVPAVARRDAHSVSSTGLAKSISRHLYTRNAGFAVSPVRLPSP